MYFLQAALLIGVAFVIVVGGGIASVGLGMMGPLLAVAGCIAIAAFVLKELKEEEEEEPEDD